jgi:hypothetical protein
MRDAAERGGAVRARATAHSLTLMTLQNLCQWLYDVPACVALRESDVVFPLVESVHVLAISLIVGTIVTVDLRVGGFILRGEPLTRVTRALLPYTWYGFALMVMTGLPLFAAEAVKLYANPAFRVKLVLLGLAGLNALVFHWTANRRTHDWDRRGAASVQARVIAGVSVVLWSGIVVSGRLIAVFHPH